MRKALAIKELREVAGIAAIALVLGMALVVYEIRSHVSLPAAWQWQKPRVPFVEDDMFVVYFSFIAASLAIVLGFRQSVGESLWGTYPFLLHLPMPRRAAILVKLQAGAGVYAVCAALPILLYGGWASIPGTRPAPFFWSMTEMTVRLFLTMPILYLGAFLSGIRPARWIGTRLLPLVGSLVLGVLIQLIPWWWTVGLALLAASIYSLTVSIVHVAGTRDF